jgi:alginate O-acetyltransferase complex protein AlgI
MLFNSFEFMVFFAVFVSLYFGTPNRWRWLPTLIASYMFYMAWRPSFAILLLASTVVDYIAALLIAASSAKATRIAVLAVSLSMNLGLLFTYKYLDFLITSLNGITNSLGTPADIPLLHLVLPVGISFYTFQTMSYTIDVFRNQIKPERHFGIFAVYVTFFPQLVAGPIERAAHLLPQFRRETRLDYSRWRAGLLLAAWGMFKKVCIADLASPFINGVYADPHSFNGSYLLLATFLFGLQIYCDFSGYSDIARGVACLLGFDLMINFRQPYFATTLGDFWRRWHISLSTWFRDYVYFPMGGNRVSRWRRVVNILVVFIISGVWHGANWTYVLWGLIHGVGLVLEQQYLQSRKADAPVPRYQILGSWFVTNLIVLISWVLFRATSVEEALYILAELPKLGPVSYGDFKLLHLPSFELLLLGYQILTLAVVDYCCSERPQWSVSLWEQRSFRWAAMVYVVYMIALFGVFGKVEFIYFQF